MRYAKNHLKINYVEISVHLYKDHLTFYKNSTNQTSTLSTGKQLILRSISDIKIVPSLPLNVPYQCQTIMLAEGAMAEPLHT